MPDTSIQARATVPCAGCGVLVPFEAWVIVDVDNRPDLVRRIREATLNIVECPQCGITLVADLPVVLYFPFEATPFVFSPAISTPEEVNARHASMSESLLRQKFAAMWQPHWLRPGLMVIRRSDLLDVLSEGFGPVLHHAYLAWCVRLYVLEYFRTDALDDKRKLVEAHSELLDEAADDFFAELIDDHYQQTGTEGLELFGEDRVLLNRCRQVGVEIAFEERRKANARSHSPDIAPLVAQLNAIVASGSLTTHDIEESTKLCRRIIEQVDPLEDGYAIAFAHSNLGQLLRRRAKDDCDLRGAIEHLEMALGSDTILDASAELYADIALEFVKAIDESSSRKDGALVDKSVSYLQRAAAKLSPTCQSQLLKRIQRQVGKLTGS